MEDGNDTDMIGSHAPLSARGHGNSIIFSGKSGTVDQVRPCTGEKDLIRMNL